MGHRRPRHSIPPSRTRRSGSSKPPPKRRNICVVSTEPKLTASAAWLFLVLLILCGEHNVLACVGIAERQASSLVVPCTCAMHERTPTNVQKREQNATSLALFWRSVCRAQINVTKLFSGRGRLRAEGGVGTLTFSPLNKMKT